MILFKTKYLEISNLWILYLIKYCCLDVSNIKHLINLMIEREDKDKEIIILLMYI